MRHDTSSRRRRVHLVAGAIAAAALMAGASTAAALIVPGRSVAGVRLNDTAAKVRKTLGAPEKGSTPLSYRYIRRRGFGVYFISNRVFQITVLRRPQATRAGVRIGTPLKRLRLAHRGVKCRTAIVGRNTMECTLRGRFAGRATATVFTTRGGRVVQIAVKFA